MDIKPIIKGVVLEVVLLTAIAVVVALLINSASPVGVPIIRTPEAAATAPVGTVPIMDVVTAESLFKTGEAVFVDARSRNNYRQGHVPGAIPLPAYGAAEDLDEAFLAFMERYASDVTIVAYCSGEHCSDSHVLAEELINMGYTSVHVFAGGVDAWQERGLAVDQADES